MAIDKVFLDVIIENIPTYPPLKPGGDVSVSEMYPELTKEELGYVMSKYTGTMRR